jgi:superfamily II DNA or RNA helicase
MAMKLKDALEPLDMESLRRLADCRGLTGGRSRKDKLQALARSYGGKFQQLFADARVADLVEMLRGTFTTDSLLEFEFSGLANAPRRDLEALALRVYEEGWDPEIEDDGEQVSGSITVRVTDLNEYWDDETDEDDEDESDDDLNNEEDLEPVEEGWKRQNDFDAGANVPLPDGLSSSTSRLAEHQTRAVTSLERWWGNGGRSGILCLPTGAGKTRVASHFALDLVQQGKSVLWLTHREELQDQAISAFLVSSSRVSEPFRVSRFGRQGARGYRDSNIVVGMVSTLAWRREDVMPNVDTLLETHGEFDLIVVDECHHAVARSWKRVLRRLSRSYPRVRVLGLSATPTRTANTEREQLWQFFGEIIHEEKPLDLIRAGVLARPVLHSVETKKSFKATADDKRHARTFHELSNRLVVEISRDVSRNELVARTFAQSAGNWGKTILFAGTREQGGELKTLLAREGISAAYVDGSHHTSERAAAVDAFKDPAGTQVLVNVGLFTEGTDLPGAQSVFIARPTQSPILFQQMLGRGLRGRAFGGTQTCNIVTFHDNVIGLFEAGLTSAYEFERKALADFGIGPAESEVSSPAPSREPQPPRALSPEVIHQVNRLRELLLARRSRSVHAKHSTAELNGWWQVNGPPSAHLPAFQSDDPWLSQFVSRVADAIQQGIKTPEYLDLDPRTLEWSFAEVALRGQETPRYISLREASMGQVQSMVDGVGRQPTNVVHKDWLSIAREINAGAPVHGVSFETRDGEVRLSEVQHELMRAFWKERGGSFAGKTREIAIERLDTMAELGALPDLPRETFNALILHGAQHGILPSPRAGQGSPPLPELARRVRELSPDLRTSAIKELHQAFASEKPIDAFLLDLIAAL